MEQFMTFMASYDSTDRKFPSNFCVFPAAFWWPSECQDLELGQLRLNRRATS